MGPWVLINARWYYTADSIDIRYAHLALAISKNPVVREFAEFMIPRSYRGQ